MVSNYLEAVNFGTVLTCRHVTNMPKCEVITTPMTQKIYIIQSNSHNTIAFNLVNIPMLTVFLNEWKMLYNPICLITVSKIGQSLGRRRKEEPGNFIECMLDSLLKLMMKPQNL